MDTNKISFPTIFEYILHRKSRDNDMYSYSYEMLHRCILYHINVATNPKLSKYDLQECLNIFYEYLQQSTNIPNDELFAAVYFACEQAEDLSNALDIRQFWKNNYPNVRPQSISFAKLLSICCAIHSWSDCYNLYCNSCLLNTDMLTYDSIELQAYHKIYPTISVFNQMLKCAHRDLAYKIYHNIPLTKEDMNDENDGIPSIEDVLVYRIKFIENEMKRNRANPNEMTWIFLLECASIAESKEFLNRILQQLFNYYMHMSDTKKKQMLRDRMSDVCILENIKYIDCRFRLFAKIVDVLFFMGEIQYALEMYHEYYKIKKHFTHWYAIKGRNGICLDFHSYTPALAAIAIRYIFEYGEIKEWRNMEENTYRMEDGNEMQLQILTGRGVGSETGQAILNPWIKSYLANEFQPPIIVHTHPKNQGILIMDHNSIENCILQEQVLKNVTTS